MRRWLIILLAVVWAVGGRAEVADSARLRLDVDATLFFRNNEFTTPLAVGYTLPGFRLAPRVCYSPTATASVEAGVYALRFWGTDEYPNAAYRDLATWTGRGCASRGFHLVPLLRGVLRAPSAGLTVVLGTLYGGRFHGLPEPLYARELELTADPEAGVQLLWEHPRAHVDAWVNWESFIYRGDTHQEAFVFGLSGRGTLTRSGAPVELTVPAAVVVQHRGGEIDTLIHNSMQTVMNATVGLSASRTFGRRWLERADFGADFMVYRTVAGELWPLRNGHAYRLHAGAEAQGVRVEAGWFGARRFVSLFGYPMYGSLSTVGDGAIYPKTGLFTLAARYRRTFAPGFELEAVAEYWRQGSVSGTSLGAETRPRRFGASDSYAIGVVMRLSPSFVLRR